ncbi:MAG: C_GCAxxG_C_C family protein [Verrucomicrobiaceae bacterium]|nr:C_GCAxxG_C_C family protein [Verrucomicrobiaceae bacterium]
MDEFTKAQKLFLEGYNCAQSVFAANADRFGIDKDIALKVSMGLGGGVGRLREVCGAFSACAMLVGLMETSTKADKERKEAVYVFVQKLAEDFKAQNGSIICRDLLKLQEDDKLLPKPDERNSSYYATRPCLRVVGIADKIINEAFSKR